MKGLELAEQFYKTYGEPLLRDRFPHLLPYIAVGLIGEGSECLGYDDDLSADHDLEPGFQIFLPGEELVSRQDAFLLEKEYNRLPKEFNGYRRSLLSPVGGSRHGIVRSASYFGERVGLTDGILSDEVWLGISDSALLEATNGKIFYDGFGEVTRIRSYLQAYPEDIRKKRLAGALITLGQSGLYNYDRCMRHGEKEAAQTAVFEFTRAFSKICFLLCGKYRPFYKWEYRALKELPLPADLASASSITEILYTLVTTPNDRPAEKEKIMERLSASLLSELQKTYSFSLREGSTLDRLGDFAYRLQDSIADPSIRNLPILFTE